MMHIADDLLSLGIMDSADSKVFWTGTRFICPSNEFGRRIEGELLIGRTSKPERLVYDIFDHGQKFRYEVSYEFAEGRTLPEFFPSRVKIEFVSESTKKTLSDYEVSRLQLSDRELTPDDVAYVWSPYTNEFPFLRTNRVHGAVEGLLAEGTTLVDYVYTNDAAHRVVVGPGGSNILKRIPTAFQTAAAMRPPRFAMRRTAVLIVLTLGAGLPIILLCLQQIKKRKNQ